MGANRRKFWVASIILAITFLSTAILLFIDAFTSTIMWSFVQAIGSTLVWAIGQAVLYKIYYVGVKPRYPLGVADQDDIYFPRFMVPRPLYLDEIKRREMERKKKELSQQENSDQDR